MVAESATGGLASRVPVFSTRVLSLGGGARGDETAPAASRLARATGQRTHIQRNVAARRDSAADRGVQPAQGGATPSSEPSASVQHARGRRSGGNARTRLS